MGLQNNWLMESSERGKPGSTHQRRAAQRAIVGSYLRKKPRFLHLQSPEVRSILKSSSGVEVSAGRPRGTQEHAGTMPSFVLLENKAECWPHWRMTCGFNQKAFVHFHGRLQGKSPWNIHPAGCNPMGRRRQLVPQLGVSLPGPHSPQENAHCSHTNHP